MSVAGQGSELVVGDIVTVGSSGGGGGLFCVIGGASAIVETPFFGPDIFVFKNGMVDVEMGSSLSSPSLSNGGVLRNNGTIVGDVINLDGSNLTGNGSFDGTLTLEEGSVLAPGNSVGTISAKSMEWNGGAAFELEADSAEGTAGGPMGWDLLSLSGVLALAPSDEPFKVILRSLNEEGEPGEVFDFDFTKDFHWTIVNAQGGITGFDESLFEVNTSDFENDLGMGRFSIEQFGNSLVLRFTAVPELGSIALVVAACISGILVRGRRKTQLSRSMARPHR